MEILSILQKLCSMLLVPNFNGIAFKNVHQIGKSPSRTTGHARRKDGGRSEKRALRKTWKDFCWGREEDGEAKSEEVWRVARVIEEVARYLELFVSYADIDGRCKQLCCESGYYSALAKPTHFR